MYFQKKDRDMIGIYSSQLCVVYQGYLKDWGSRQLYRLYLVPQTAIFLMVVSCCFKTFICQLYGLPFAPPPIFSTNRSITSGGPTFEQHPMQVASPAELGELRTKADEVPTKGLEASSIGFPKKGRLVVYFGGSSNILYFIVKGVKIQAIYVYIRYIWLYID